MQLFHVPEEAQEEEDVAGTGTMQLLPQVTGRFRARSSCWWQLEIPMHKKVQGMRGVKAVTWS